MTATRTERSSMTLAEFVRREMTRRRWSIRDVEGHTGVSRTAIANILNNADAVPTLETLDRLGSTFGLPLWRMVELAGYQSGMPSVSPRNAIERVTILAEAMPQLAELLDEVLELPPSEMAGVLAYLEALKRRRDRNGLGQDDPVQ